MSRPQWRGCLVLKGKDDGTGLRDNHVSSVHTGTVVYCEKRVFRMFMLRYCHAEETQIQFTEAKRCIPT